MDLNIIRDLKDNFFVIPSYQRGYRWQKQQVRDLLNDILNFEQQGENFYCLQPLVVKERMDKHWIVLDGQQRLTTIFLIFKFLNIKSFEIEYETRKESREFLESINKNGKDKNIDFWHIYEAFECIKEFFKGKDNIKENFKNKLLEHTKMIWYEISDNEKEIELFTRINMGKIPLTNAELIRALLLKGSKEEKKEMNQLELAKNQLEIAIHWDFIENTLHNDDFWYFLSNDDSPTRIDLIFQLLALDIDKENKEKEYGTYFSFCIINDNFKENPQEIWGKAKEIYRILKEWFDDRECFHKIGFLLIDSNSTKILSEFLYEYTKQTKIEFKKYLDEQIKENLKRSLKEDKSKIIDLESLEYGKNSALIKKILLLFNIQSLLANETSQTKFNFKDFKTEKWDIEHIHSQNEKIESSFVEWLQIQLVYGDIKYNKEKIKELFNRDSNFDIEKEAKVSKENDFKEKLEKYFGKGQIENKIQEIYSKYAESYNSKENLIKEIDSIKNLTLLDRGINRSYKNAFFPTKRNRIIELDKTSTFVPLCTRNVFVKYYSKNDTDSSIWSDDDANTYLEAIKESLKAYLVGEENSE